jgi:hypothetical protein
MPTVHAFSDDGQRFAVGAIWCGHELLTFLVFDRNDAPGVSLERAVAAMRRLAGARSPAPPDLVFHAGSAACAGATLWTLEELKVAASTLVAERVQNEVVALESFRELVSQLSQSEKSSALVPLFTTVALVSAAVSALESVTPRCA